MVEAQPGRQTAGTARLEDADAAALREPADPARRGKAREETAFPLSGNREEQRVVFAAGKGVFERGRTSQRNRLHLDLRAAPARGAEVAQVAEQSVAHVDGRGGERAGREAGFQERFG